MQNTEDSFIDKVVDCMENIELVNDSYTKIDKFVKERKYSGLGFRYTYNRYISESIELEAILRFCFLYEKIPVIKLYKRP